MATKLTAYDRQVESKV